MPVSNNTIIEDKNPEQDEHTQFFWTRVDSVVVLILENDKYLQSKRNVELTKTIIEQFSVSDRTAQRYIAEAKKAVRRLGLEKRDKAFDKAIRDREFLFQKAKGTKGKDGKYIDEPDYKLALEVVKDRDKIKGLYIEEIKHSGEITVKNIDYSKFTDYGLERLKKGDPVEQVMIDPKSVKI